MSNKGINQTLATRQKIGLANQKDRAIITQKVAEYISTLKKDSFPSLTSASIYANINEKNLVAFEMSTEEGSDIRLLLDTIRDLQKEALIYNGLTKRYDSKIVSLLLKAHHGLKEEPLNMTQNNIYNVSPEILAEAIELTRKKPPHA